MDGIPVGGNQMDSPVNLDDLVQSEVTAGNGLQGGVPIGNNQGQLQQSDIEPGILDDPNAPDRFSQAYQSLQSKKDQEIAAYRKRVEEMEAQLAMRNDLGQLQEFMVQNPGAAKDIYSVLESHLGGQGSSEQQPQESIEKPEPPDLDQYDLDDPDDAKLYYKHMSQYQAAMEQYNAAYLDYQLNTRVGPLQQFIEQQEQQRKMNENIGQLRMISSQVGLGDSDVQEMVNKFSQKNSVDMQDLVAMHLGYKMIQQRATGMPQHNVAGQQGQVLQQQQREQLSTVGHQRALRQQFPIPPQGAGQKRFDPVEVLQQAVIAQGNTRTRPRVQSG